METHRSLYNRAIVLASAILLTQVSAAPALAMEDAFATPPGQESVHVQLKGKVTKEDFRSKVAVNLDHLLVSALDKNAEAQQLRKSLSHCKGGSYRAAMRCRDLLLALLPFEGFANSKEAAALILDEKTKQDDELTCSYQLQKVVDQLQPQIVLSVLEIAMAVGEPDALESQRMINKGTNSLAQLVGVEDAQATVVMLKDWQDQLGNQKASPGKAWDIQTYHRNINCASEAAVAQDPLILKIDNQLLKFRHPGRAKETIAGALESAFEICRWVAPGFGTPAAAAFAKALVVAAAGGPEEDKELKELYLSKRIESRCESISNQVQMAMTSYQMATLQGNRIFADCSQAIVATLATDDQIIGVIARHLTVEQKGKQQSQL